MNWLTGSADRRIARALLTEAGPPPSLGAMISRRPRHDRRCRRNGGTGQAGAETPARLDALPQVAPRSLPAEHRKDKAARRDIMAEVDLVVLCLPDDAARESAG